MKAHYSIIQYCPDRGRDERLNLGLVVLTNDGRLRARYSIQCVRRACSVFDIVYPDDALVAAFARYAVHRISEDIKTLDDLKHFADTRANDIRLTAPRHCRIDDMEADFERMFSGMVEWKGE